MWPTRTWQGKAEFAFCGDPSFDICPEAFHDDETYISPERVVLDVSRKLIITTEDGEQVTVTLRNTQKYTTGVCRVQLGFDAPDHIEIDREEIRELKDYRRRHGESA